MQLGSGDLLSQVTSKTSSPRHWDLPNTPGPENFGLGCSCGGESRGCSWGKYPSAARTKPTVCGVARGGSITLSSPPPTTPTSYSYIQPAWYRLFPLPWSLHLAGLCSFLPVQLACPSSGKPPTLSSVPHTPLSQRLLLCAGTSSGLELPEIRTWPHSPLHPGPDAGLGQM